MGVFTSNYDLLNDDYLEDEEEFEFDEYEEMCAISYLSRQPDEVIHEFVQSEECDALITEGKLNKKQIIRLNKDSDLVRRQTLAAFAAAKKRNDPDYAKFVKYKSLANDYKNKIKNKYGNKVTNVAKKSQRDFISGRSTSGQIKSAIDSRRKNTIKQGSAGRV